MNRRARAILWLDGGAAGLAGLAVLAARAWLARRYAFAPALVLFVGAANLVYSSYSSTLAALASSGRTPPRRAIEILVIANAAWVIVCGALLVATASSATLLGHAHLGGEGLFVAALGCAEWRLVRPFAR